MTEGWPMMSAEEVAALEEEMIPILPPVRAFTLAVPSIYQKILTDTLRAILKVVVDADLVGTFQITRVAYQDVLSIRSQFIAPDRWPSEPRKEIERLIRVAEASSDEAWRVATSAAGSKCIAPSDISQDFDFLWTDDLLAMPVELIPAVETLFKVNDDLGRLLSMDTRRHWVRFRFHILSSGNWQATATPLIESRKWVASQELLLRQALDEFNRQQMAEGDPDA